MVSKFPHLLVLLLLPFDAEASVTRSLFPMEGDVAWVVQVSDLHISSYHPKRAADLTRLLGRALLSIRPHLLLLTGDITDAKNRKRTSSRQDEAEWILYKNTIDAIVRKGGIDKHRIFDIRGNHDKYGVPSVGDYLDFFSTYSVSSQFHRLSTINSILLQGNRNYLFMGIDDTLSVGVRFPANLFGHPTERRMQAVNSELQYWTNNSDVPITKVIFGHFPMSFTSASDKGQRYESIFAEHSISAYMCGHLHAKVSKKLWRFHEIRTTSKVRKAVGSFWEWELGDWKESRLMRILAIDGGAVSFVDHILQETFQTAALITYPTDSRSMNTLESNSWSLRNDINALVFSAQVIRNVSARVFDSHREFKVVEEIPLQLVSGTIDKPLFHAKWNAQSYRNASPTRYWLQVLVLDSHGKKTLSEQRPFSVDGAMAIQPSPWINYLVFEIQWENMYHVLLWINLAFALALLSSPKIFCFFKKSSLYQRWAVSVLSASIQERKTYFWVVWFLMEGSRSRVFWFSLVIYILWLIKMPWFWGHATSASGEIARMCLSGWAIPSLSDGLMCNELGSPDIMVITLPVLYFVVIPLILLIYGLFAEQAVVYLRHNKEIEESTDPRCLETRSAPLLQCSESALVLFSDKVRSLVNKFSGGWMRRALLLACLIITMVHLKLCSLLMAAYGEAPVALSPALTWMPLLLLGAAVYCTMVTAD